MPLCHLPPPPVLPGGMAPGPDAVAIVAGSRHLSRGDLVRRVEELAARLRQRGVGPEVVVALAVERSPEMVVAALAVLAAEAAYLPLDPEDPDHRLAALLRQGSARWVLTQERLAERFAGLAAGLEVVAVDAPTAVARAQAAVPGSEAACCLDLTSSPADPRTLAYVLPTSGSGGRPKLVEVSRGALEGYTADAVEGYGIQPTDRVLQFAALSFDASVEEIYPALACGAVLALRPEQRFAGPRETLRLVERERVSVLPLPTAFWHQVVDSRVAGRIDGMAPALELPPALRLVIIGGEMASAAHLARWRDWAAPGAVELVNGYGPTEATVVATRWWDGPVGRESAAERSDAKGLSAVDAALERVPIGRAIDVATVRLLDRAGRPLAQGKSAEIGEIAIGGGGVARGYRGSPGQTAESFVPDPCGAHPGARLYRSGDLGRWRRDGDLEILGRLDDQVKMRGVRVEPGEVAAVLREHPAVAEVAVQARGGRLVAWVVPDVGARAAEREAWRRDHVAQNRRIYEDLYRRRSEDPAFDTTGWNSSYSDRPLPADEMREWVGSTVARLRQVAPPEPRILEIGCGTGLLLHRLAPGAARYVATDFSPLVIESLRRSPRLANLEGLELHVADADDLDAFARSAEAEGGFDLVVLNSVAQYFPDLGYFERVVRGAVRATASGGIVVLGDLRSLPLRTAFAAEVELARSSARRTVADLRRGLARRLHRDAELYLDPRFVVGLSARLAGAEGAAQVTGARVLLRHGRAANEMNRFRFDAVLEVGTAPRPQRLAGAFESWGWDTELGSLEDLEQRLAARAEPFGLLAVPNARTLVASELAERIATVDPTSTVADLRRWEASAVEAQARSERGVDPADLTELAASYGYGCAASWARVLPGGRFDALLWPLDSAEHGLPNAADLDALIGGAVEGAAFEGAAFKSTAAENVRIESTTAREPAWSECANDPLLSRVEERWVPELRREADARLVPAARPAAYVVLERLPLTRRGKLDRDALPPPFTGRPPLATPFVAPRGELEESLAEIWRELLGFAEVGVHDDFFRLGGHSLTAARCVERIAQRLGLEVPLERFFAAPTVAGLAAEVEAGRRRAGHPPLVERQQLSDWSEDVELPLSFAQERLWFHAARRPESSAYVTLSAHRLEGDLDPDALAAAWTAVVRRHEVLRTRFPSRDGRPRQEILPAGSPKIRPENPFRPCLPRTERKLNPKGAQRSEHRSQADVDERGSPAGSLEVWPARIDLSSVAAADRSRALERLLARQARWPFELATGPLARVLFVRLEGAVHVVVVALHHAITDDWSDAVLHRELAAFYGAARSGASAILARLVVQPADVALWERARWQRKPAGRLSARCRRLAGVAPAAWPVDRPAGSGPPPDCAGVVRLPELPSSELRRLAAEAGVSLFMVCLSGLAALLRRQTGQRGPLTMATPAADRPHDALEEVIGFFVNTLVIRLETTAGDGHDPSFGALLRATRGAALEAFAHRDVPFEKLIEALRPERRPWRQPLVHLLMALANAPRSPMALDGLQVEPLAVPVGLRFDMSWQLWEEGGCLKGEVAYDPDLYDATTVHRAAGYWWTFLSAAAADPDTDMDALPLLSRGQRHQVSCEWPESAEWPGSAWRAGEVDNLGEQILLRAAVLPDAIAVIAGARALSFGELARRAEGLATDLRHHGVGQEVRVGICSPRRLELVVAVVGVLRAGGVYVPLDPRHPEARRRELARRAGVEIELCGATLQVAASSPGLSVRRGDRRRGFSDARQPVDPRSAAYVLFTSGSSGRPKGVVVERRQLTSYVAALVDRLGLRPGLRAGLVQPLAVDSSVSALFPPLVLGGCLVLLDEDIALDPARLRASLVRQPVDLLKIAPSHLAALDTLPARVPMPLRWLVVGGETLHPETAESWRRALAEEASGGEIGRLINHYGPTEATVGVLAWPVVRPRSGRRPVPVGRPLGHATVRIVDPRLGQVEVGAPGELAVGEARARTALARGYLDDPAATAAAFVPDPWSVFEGGRLYLTGDLARWRADGVVELLGRRDTQVQIRGLRVEPGEVEAVLLSHPALREAMVQGIAVGETYELVAWIVPERAPPAASDLRRHLASRLPAAMVPTRWSVIERLPRTAHGKLDRGALLRDLGAAADLSLSPTGESLAEWAGDGPPGPPRTLVEAAVAEIWGELLELDPVDVEADFFASGGHSLLVPRLVARLRRTLEVEIAVEDVFLAPSVAGLAARIESARRGGEQALAPLPLRRRRVSRLPRVAPVTAAQAVLWMAHHLDPEGAAYTSLYAWRLRPVPNRVADALRGVCPAALFNMAWGALVRRHEALRTSFFERAGRPRQRVAPWTPMDVARADLARLGAAEGEAEARRLAIHLQRLQVDVANGPLARAVVVERATGASWLLAAVHHLSSDGISRWILDRELGELLKAGMAGGSPRLRRRPVQPADVGVWEAASRWRSRTAPEPGSGAMPGAGALPSSRLPPSRLPVDGRAGVSSPGDREAKAAVYTFGLPPSDIRALEEHGRRVGASRFMAWLGVTGAWLQRLSASVRVEVGVPLAGRSQPEVLDTVGAFVRLGHLELDLGGRPDAPGLFERSRAALLEAQAMAGARPSGALPEVVLSLEPTTRVPRILSAGSTELELAAFDLEPPTLRFGLELELTPTASGGLQAALVYPAARFDTTTVMRFGEVFARLASGIAAKPMGPVDQVPILGPAARHQVLVEWGRGPEVDGSHSERIGAGDLLGWRGVASRRPDAIAVVDGDAFLSYGELARRTGRLASRLSSVQGVPVGLACGRSLVGLVGLLGLVEAGAVWVPLDPAEPMGRWRFILADAGVRLVLSESRLAIKVRAAGADAMELLGAVGDRPEAGVGGEIMALERDPGAVAVLYTSGSSGRPKGVVVRRAALSSFVRTARRIYELGASDRVLQFAAWTFDTACEEILPTLLAGATVVLRGDDLVPLALADEAAARRITVLDLPTAYWHELVDELDAPRVPGVSRRVELPASVRLVILGGEAARGEALAKWRRRVAGPRLVNTYGPTEATVIATLAKLSSGRAEEAGHRSRDPVIGRPLPGVVARVLDRRGEEVPVGTPGELHLGETRPGRGGLARGYVGRPRLTAGVFRPDPWSSAPGGRLYATGDQVRWTATGQLDFLGRRDRQIKIRGVRIEPAEIEVVLTAHPGVASAAVVVLGRPGDLKLAAFAVPRDRAAPPTVADLREVLAERLPSALMPSLIGLTGRLPKTRHGKLDHRALQKQVSRPEHRRRAPEGAEGSAARSPLEALVLGIWREVLGKDRGGPDLGIHDDFFARGGHSLDATRVVSRLRRAGGVELSLRSFFAAPTVAGLAARVAAERGGGKTMPHLRRVPRDGPLLPSFAQERLWWVDQLAPGDPAWIMCSAFRVRGGLRIDWLADALQALTARHEALRTRLTDLGDGPRQLVEERLVPELVEIDLGALEPVARQRDADRWLGAVARRPFDLERGPLLRAAVFSLGEVEARREDLLVLACHHIVSDGWSESVLLRDLGLLYGAAAPRANRALADLRLQYADFAAWQRTWLLGGVLEHQLEAWCRRLEGLQRLDLPTDRPRVARAGARASARAMRWPASSTGALQELARRRGASLFMVLLAAFQAFLGRLGSSRDIAVVSPIANRHHADLEGIMGFFVNLLVLRADLGGRPTFLTLLAQTREHALDAYAHQDLPFERLVEALAPPRELGRHPLAQVSLALQNAPEPGLRLAGTSCESISLPPSGARFDLELSIWEEGGALAGTWISNREIFDPTTAARWCEAFGVFLEGAVASPERRLDALPMLGRGAVHQVLQEWSEEPTSSSASGAASVSGSVAMSFPALLAAGAADHPQRIALVAGNFYLSWAELWRRIQRQAVWLRSREVGPDAFVAVDLEPGGAADALEIVETLVGVLLAGGAYLPIEAADPRWGERLRAAGPVLRWRRGDGPERQDEKARTPGALPPGSRNLPAPHKTSSPHKTPDPSKAPDPRSAAYLLFTSGSTGRPKGVVVPHGALASYLGAAAACYPLGGRALVATRLDVDLTVTSLLGTLAAGGTAVLIPELILPGPADVTVLHRALVRSPVFSVLKLTPTHLRLLAAQAVATDSGIARDLGPAPEALVVGGEVFRGEDLEAWPQSLVINEYGPTEATVGCAIEPCTPGAQGALPVGRPLGAARLVVLDKVLRPVPVGLVGELLVGGPGLARGYLDPRRTAERFRPDPTSTRPGARLYATGDLARWRPDGRLELAGRRDHQLKVGGRRIEPQEIEGVLRLHPAVVDAVVTADNGRLVAWVEATAVRRAAWSRAQVEAWRAVYAELYGVPGETGLFDPELDFSGWRRSTDDQPIPPTEMREWVAATVAMVASRRPRRILELGCGSGLLLWRLAPACERYVATDFSVAMLKRLAAHRESRGLDQVELLRRDLGDFRGIEEASFDIVLMSSVVQYLPDRDSLHKVIAEAWRRVAPGGALVLADLRHLGLHGAFCAEVEEVRAARSGEAASESGASGSARAEILRRAARRQAREKELLIDPAAFGRIADGFGDVARWRVAPRRGRASNELTRYRFDAILERHGPGLAEGLEERRIAAPPTAWRPGRSLAEDLRRWLVERPEVWIVTGVANGRLESGGIDPELWPDLAAELGYGIELSWAMGADDGSYDALLWRRDSSCSTSAASWIGVAPEVLGWPPRPNPRALSAAAPTNDPLMARAARELRTELGAHLRRHLPAELSALRIVPVEALPQLPGGKVDRKALAERRVEDPGERPELARRFMAPRDATEGWLVKCWARALGIDQVGIHDNFFALGGDSISGLRVVSEARRRGFDLVPGDLFVHQTVARLAAVLAARPMASQGMGARRRPVPGPLPLAPLQAWFLELGSPDPHHFNWAEVLTPNSRLTAQRLVWAAGVLVARHEALRLRFDRHEEGWRQRLSAEPGPGSGAWLDLACLAPRAARAALESSAARLQTGLDLGHGPLLRILGVEMPDGRQRVVLVVHHLVVDAVSWPVLVEDLAVLLTGTGESLGRDPAVGFGEWMRRLEVLAQSPEIRAEVSEWSARLADLEALPVDGQPSAMEAASHTAPHVVELSETLTATLVGGLAEALRARVDEALLAAIACAAVPWTGRRVLHVDLERHGRDALAGVDASRTVGWLAMLHPLRIELPAGSGRSAAAALMAVKEELRQLPRHGIGWGLLRHLGGPSDAVALARFGAPSLRFNYVGPRRVAEDVSAVGGGTSFFETSEESVGPEMSRHTPRPYALEVDAMRVDGRLRIEWTYDPRKLHQTTVEALAQRALEALAELVESARGDGQLAPSDVPASGLEMAQLADLVERSGLPARLIEDVYPLVLLQEGMLFDAAAAPGGAVYHEQSAWDLGDGAMPLDVEALRAASRALVARHPALRTAFVDDGSGRSVQVVRRRAEVPWEEHDWRHLPPGEQDAHLAELLATDRRQGFDLAHAPLFRLFLLRLGSMRWRLVWSLHHLIIDGWSTQCLREELGDLYHAARRPGPRRSGSAESQELASALPPAPPLGVFVAWQMARDRAVQARFWRRELAGFHQPTHLHEPLQVSTSEPRSAEETMPREHLLRLDAAPLAAFARRSELTLNTVVQGAWALVLGRDLGCDEALFGVTVALRPAEIEAVERLVGPLINTLPLRVELAPGHGVTRWLEALQARNVELREHAATPLVEIREASEIAPPTALFDHVLVFESYPKRTTATELLRETESGFFSRTGLPLTLTVSARGLLEVAATSERGVLGASRVERLLARLGVALDALPQVASGALGQVPVWSRAERHQVLCELADTGRPQPWPTVVHGVLQRAAATPDALALSFLEADGESPRALTYAGLVSQAASLARSLRARGAGPDVPVTLALERSPAMAVTVLGTLMSGAAYVPIDPAWPAQRRHRMLDTLAQTCPGPHLAVTAADLHAVEIEPLTSSATAPDVLPDALGYVIFTSGSTGRPKGIALSHAALANLVAWHLETFVTSRRGRFLQLASLSFDASFHELFAAWCGGGCAVLVPEELRRDTRALARHLGTEKVAKAIVPVVTLHRLAEELVEPPGSARLAEALGDLVVTGEQLVITPAVRQLFSRRPQIAFHNHYGPAETHVVTACRLGSPSSDWSDLPPIGRALANVSIRLLDRRGHWVGLGGVGELFVGGVALARGYIGQPALTAQRFMPDAFADATPSAPSGGRLYATGDLARWTSSGELLFLGRRDTQVKIRGHRVELEEVEAVLVAHPAVREAAVVVAAAQAGSASSAERELVACVVCPEVVPPAAELARWVEARLPEPMVPRRVLQLDALPLTPTGKIDRARLAHRAPEATRAGVGQGEGGSDAPRGVAEELVAACWAEVLELEPGLHLLRESSFFELGGHSLQAARVVAWLRRVAGVDLPLRRLFERPALAAFAAEVEAARRSKMAHPRGIEPTIGPAHDPADGAPLSFAQEGLWLAQTLAPSSTDSHLSNLWRLSGELDLGALRAALRALARRHPALRTVIVEHRGKAWQKVLGPGAFRCAPLVDLTSLVPGAPEAMARRLLREARRRPYNLARGPLARPWLLRLGSTEHIVAFDVHHLVFDGWSEGIMARELAALYGAARNRRCATLPVLRRHPFQAAVEERERWRRWNDGADPRRAKFLEDFRHLEAPNLPIDREPPSLGELAMSRRRPAACDLRLAPTLVARLERRGRRSGATLFMTLLAAYGALLTRLGARPPVVLGTAAAERPWPDLEGLVGCFVNLWMLRLEPDPRRGATVLLSDARAATLDAFDRRDLPYEVAVSALSGLREPGRPPLVRATLTLQSAPGGAPRLPGIEVSPLANPEPAPARFDLELHAWRQDDGNLGAALVYAPEIFEATTIARLGCQLSGFLEALVAADEQPLEAWPVLVPAARHQLLREHNATRRSWPAAPESGFLDSLLVATAARFPNRVAVDAEREQLTYGRLMKRAERLASALREAGIGPEEIVGIAEARVPARVVALIAILRAGAAWLPLEPGEPSGRSATILEDAGTRWVVTGEEPRRIRPAGATGRSGEAEWRRRPFATPYVSTARRHPDQAAYLIYTSGSTGRPKGVLISHRAALNRLLWMQEVYRLGPGEAVLHKTPFGFDISVWELLWPLLNGGRLVLAAPGEERDPVALAARAARRRVAVMHFVPSLLEPFLEAFAPSKHGALRQVIASGETLPPALARRAAAMFEGARLDNLYGPTEAAVEVSIWSLGPGQIAALGGRVPIGRPATNTCLHVVDPALRLLPLGVTGELVIGGVQLARGYLGRAAKTALAFVPDPFTTRERDTAGGRLYRSGDLARRQVDGTLDLLGRFDRQVKVSGVRVELGGIEAVLLGDAQVEEAAVVAIPSMARGQLAQDLRLVAFVVVRSGALGESRDELGGALRRRLADCSQGAGRTEVVFCDSLPRTSSGKLDRQDLEHRAIASVTVTDAGRAAEDAPRGARERLVADLWEEILGVSLGRHDDVFAQGAHSLLAARFLARLYRVHGAAPPLVALFEHPTVAGLAAVLPEPRRIERLHPADPVLVELAAGPDPAAVPFVCVHALDGEVLPYRELARQLMAERGVFGIQARFPQGSERKAANDLGSLVAAYAARLRAIQPRGPYLLGGWSSGGTVAYELACQLREAGEEVALLALLDAHAPPLTPGSGSRLPTFEDLFDAASRVGAPWVNALSRDELDLRMQRHARHASALQAYRPRPYPGPVVLLRAAAEIGPREVDPYLGWRRWASSIERLVVPGDHESILRVPLVDELSFHLARELRSALEGPAAHSAAPSLSSLPPTRLAARRDRS